MDIIDFMFILSVIILTLFGVWLSIINPFIGWIPSVLFLIVLCKIYYQE